MSFLRRSKAAHNLRRFRRAKFNYNKFLQRYYIENDDAYISAKVTSYQDIINPFSIKNYEWVNKEFVAYIEECAYFVPPENKIILDICGCKFTQAQQSTIRRVILDYFGLQMEDKMSDLADNTKNIIRLLLGLVLSGIFYIAIGFTPLGSFILVEEFKIVLFWFFLWELVDRIAIERRDLQTEKLYAGQLAALRIEFTDEKTLTKPDPNIEELDELDDVDNFKPEAEEPV